MPALVPVPAARLGELVGRLADDRPPLYAALAGRLRLLVADGRLAVGVRLPAERDLAAVLHVSRATVTAAYRRLREDGWADARQGSATWTRLPAGPDLGSWLPGPAEPGVVDLAHAAPPAPPQVGAAYAAALADLPRLLPDHGYAPHGLPELRARIADTYTARGLPTTVEQVLVTGGALHAASVALQVLAGPGDGVLVEDPSYPNVLDALRAQGARLVPAAVDAADPDGAVRALTRTARATRPRAAYLVPDFANPSGLLLDAAQRRRLAVGLEPTGAVVVVDETLAELGLDGAPAPPPYAAVSPPGAAVSIGSMSKAFWGGLRLGWLRAEPEVVQRCARVLAGAQLALPVLEQLAACHLLDTAEQVLPAARTRLRTQRDALVGAVQAALPHWEVPVPAGGLVLWCRLSGVSSTALAAAAETCGLRLAAGPRFTASGGDDRLRLPYTHPPEVLVAAVDRLAALVEQVGTARPRNQPDAAGRLVV